MGAAGFCRFCLQVLLPETPDGMARLFAVFQDLKPFYPQKLLPALRTC